MLLFKAIKLVFLPYYLSLTAHLAVLGIVSFLYIQLVTLVFFLFFSIFMGFEPSMVGVEVDTSVEVSVSPSLPTEVSGVANDPSDMPSEPSEERSVLFDFTLFVGCYVFLPVADAALVALVDIAQFPPLLDPDLNPLFNPVLIMLVLAAVLP